jgi:integrase
VNKSKYKAPLTVKAVQALHETGLYSDGRNGLYLRVTNSGSKSWIYRYRDRATGKLRDMGLGAVGQVGLATARHTAEDARRIVAAGGDPIRDRRLEQAEQKAESIALHEYEHKTFDWCAEQYIKGKVEPESRNVKHVQQWRNTMRNYASPVIGSLPVDQVDDHHILAILEPIWHTKTETAQRVMQRLTKILNWAKVRKLRSGDNPALWAGHLETMLPSPAKIKKVTHHASLAYAEAPAFMQELGNREGHRARCLELVMITACRTTEARAAQWPEFDLDAKLWIIPAERMKAGKEHRVPLSPAAIAILKGQQGVHEKWVFPGERGQSCLTNMAMLMLLRDMEREDFTVHGFRSTFRNWAAEQTNFPREVCEQALAHQLKDATEAAYLHTDLLEKRRKLMNQWAKFLTS